MARKSADQMRKTAETSMSVWMGVFSHVAVLWAVLLLGVSGAPLWLRGVSGAERSNRVLLIACAKFLEDL